MDFGKFDDQVSAMKIQKDGKIILGGNYMSSLGVREFALARYNSDGSLDKSFNSDGKLTFFKGTDDVGNSIALQNDGKILFAGGIFNGQYADLSLIRFNTDGTLDSTFNKIGYVTTAIGTKTDYARSLAIQSDGKIITGGAYNDDKEFNFALVRYHSNGSLDTSFSNDGIATLNIGAGNDIINSLVLQSDGKILVTGPIGFGGGASDFSVVRFNTNGTLDKNFGIQGKTITSINSNGEDYPTTILLQPDDKIILVGTSDTGSQQEIAIARYNKDGSLDLTFSMDGIVKTDISKGPDSGNSATLQKDGKILVTGYTYNGTKYDLLLLRYNTNGDLDNSFGKGGIQTYSFTNGHDLGSVIDMQSDGKILVGGSSGVSTDYSFTLTRYLSKVNLGILNLSPSKSRVLFYPNPATEFTTLEYTLTNETIITIQLKDFQGKIIKTFINNEKQFAGKYEQPLQLPVDLASGNYLLTISTPNNEQVTIKFIK